MFKSLVLRGVLVQPRALFSHRIFTRSYASEPSIKERLQAVIPVKQAQVKRIKELHGKRVLPSGECTIEHAYGGMRFVSSLVTETSLLDPSEGIMFRGLSIPEVIEKLPKAKGGSAPLPEGLIFLMLTGEVPSANQAETIRQELVKRAAIPEHVVTMIKNFPKDLHPMSQFSAAVLGLQKDSKFARAYQGGVKKDQYWETTLEDSLDLIAKLSTIAAMIYQHTYKGDKSFVPLDPNLDWSANFARMLGFNKPEFDELMRLYLVLHSDYEGGNVFAHATHLVGSALSDPYLSLSTGLNGLAGPLQGLTSQEVLVWISDFKKHLGDEEVSDMRLVEVLEQGLNVGRVIPGYGNSILRKTDPRYICMREFALKNLPDDPLFKLVSQIYMSAPKLLRYKQGIKNAWPPVEAHSGVIFHHYGLKELPYHTVLLGVSRAIGSLSSLVWDRILQLPLERPKSVTSDWIQKWAENPASVEEK